LDYKHTLKKDKKKQKSFPVVKIIYGTAILIFCIVSVFAGARYWWREHRFRYIVVHHTASDYGDLKYYREVHQKERGWSDIAYHFLINNGTANTSMGQIEESDLWKTRSRNFSTKVDYINYFGIAVVLVGNFENHKVPPVQRESLINLLVRLAKTYDIPPDRIIGHRELQQTACPGKHLNMSEIRESVKKSLGEK